MIDIFTRNGRCRLRIRLLEWAAGRGFYPAERRLQSIRESGPEPASTMAWRALNRLRQRRFYALCAELDEKRAGGDTRHPL